MKIYVSKNPKVRNFNEEDEVTVDDIIEQIGGWIYNVLGRSERKLEDAYDNPGKYVDKIIKDICNNLDLTKSELFEIADKSYIENLIEDEAQSQLDNF